MQQSNSLKSSTSRLRCAIYTRKSTEEGLDHEFNSLDAQREAAEAFIQSQRREGWIALPELYDDGGFTGANMDRPALKRLLQAVEAGELDCVVVYKVDRLSRSLLDFTRMLSMFEKYKVSFVYFIDLRADYFRGSGARIVTGIAHHKAFCRGT